MASPKSPSPKKPISDIAQPNKTAPSATSKPVIVTNRPILRDPMMSEVKTTAPVTAAAPKRVTKEVTITPPGSKPAPPELPETDTSASALQDEPADSAAAETVPEPPAAATAPAPDQATDEPATSDAGPISERQQEEQAAAATAQREAIAKLVESEKYFLPINSLEKRRAKRFIALGVVLILLLAVAWADVALDAGLIAIPGLNAPTHFFSN